MASSGSGKKMTNMRRISLTRPETGTIFAHNFRPPSLSSMNSIPAISNARQMAASSASETWISPSMTSALRIVATPTVGARAKSRAVHRLALELRASWHRRRMPGSSWAAMKPALARNHSAPSGSAVIACLDGPPCQSDLGKTTRLRLWACRLHRD